MAKFTPSKGLEQKVAKRLVPEVTRITRAAARGAQNAAPPEKVWKCVSADTSVGAFGAYAAARRHYEGALVRITTASGRSFAVTPEHRVLTGRGWLPAQFVDESDHLVQVVGVPATGAPHVQDGPTGIGERIDALVAALPGQVRTVRGAVDLYGQVVDAEIQVVPPDRALAAYLEAGLPQGMEQLMLTDADSLTVPRLLRLGSPSGLLCRLRCVAEPLLNRALATLLALFRCQPGHPDVTRLRVSSGDDALLLKDAPHHQLGAPMPGSDGPRRVTAGVFADNCTGGDVVASPHHIGYGASLRQLFTRFGSRSVSTARVADVQQLPLCAQPALDSGVSGPDGKPDLSWGLPRLVATDDVRHVRAVAYSGHVYDLSTLGGWYLADGIVIHNSQGDALVRPEHAKAHDQAVPDNLRFTLDSPIYDQFHYGAGLTQMGVAPRDEDGFTPGNTCECRCFTDTIPDGVSKTISAHPARAIGTKVVGRVTCDHELSVQAEYGTGLDQGVRFMAAGLRAGKRAAKGR